MSHPSIHRRTSENFVDVHARKIQNVMNAANCMDSFITLISPMLISTSWSFPEEVFHSTTEDTRLEGENLWLSFFKIQINYSIILT